MIFSIPFFVPTTASSDRARENATYSISSLLSNASSRITMTTGDSSPLNRVTDPLEGAAPSANQLMKLDKRYLTKLEDRGYITRKKIGREVEVSITDSGKYVACVSGMVG